MQFGTSAIVTDLRVYVTPNSFNVFVTQPVMQPSCNTKSCLKGMGERGAPEQQSGENK